jgi:hypothetical protein
MKAGKLADWRSGGWKYAKLAYFVLVSAFRYPFGSDTASTGYGCEIVTVRYLLTVAGFEDVADAWDIIVALLSLGREHGVRT